MKRLWLNCLDFCIRWRNWYVHRRDSLANLQTFIEQQEVRHQQEVERLNGEILIRDKQIKLLAAMHEKHSAYIERETAIFAKERAAVDTAAKLGR